MDDRWIDSIKDKMAEYDFAPPDGLLESVQEEIRIRRIKRMRLWGAVAASIALLGGIFVAMISEKTEKYVPLIVDVAYEDKETESINSPMEKTVFYAATVSKPKRARVTGGSIPAADCPASITPLSSEATQEKAQEDLEGDEKNYAEPCGSYQSYTVDSGVNTDCKESHVSGFPLSVGVAASANGLGGLIDGDTGGPLPNTSSIPYTRMGGGIMSDSHTNDAPTPRFIETFDHKLPVRFSVDFSLPIAHNLSAGAGICYSYLRSDIRYGYSDHTLYKAIQNLHFIGIPVNLRFTPWRSGKFGVYVSVGVMGEKCLGGELKEDSPSNPTYRYEGYDDRPFQFSFNAAAGLQYSPAHKCALFLEPGVGLYLKNGSKLRTIYSERPLTFNVNVGLRFGY